MDVEITLPDRTRDQPGQGGPRRRHGQRGGAVKAPFVPFPVALPTDAELVWVLARREDLGPDEAARALAHIEEEFWSSKAGQKRLQATGAERHVRRVHRQRPFGGPTRKRPQAPLQGARNAALVAAADGRRGSCPRRRRFVGLPCSRTRRPARAVQPRSSRRTGGRTRRRQKPKHPLTDDASA